MASYTLSEEIAVTAYDFDPGSTTIVDIGWVDMSGYSTFMVCFVRTVGTGALDTMRIAANPESDGSGTDVTVVTKTISSEPNAVGDLAIVECSWDDVATADTSAQTARYISAQLQFATATDEGVVIYIRGTPRVAKASLTADVIA